MKRMLINATHVDEIRVAIADGQKLYDLDIDSAGHYRKKGNIYKARITRIEPSLEACFVNYGSERHGFLPYKEISPVYCKQAPKGQSRLPINEALKEGDEIIVQVNKEERGNKGAALSTFISLAGRYLVFMPGNHRAGGISRQIRGEKRAHLQDIMRRLEIPKNDGVIIRTAGLGCAFEELEWDFKYLQQVWQAIKTAADNKKAPFFIYQESDLFIRALRDYLHPDIGEILIDDRESYEKAREFMQQVMPHNLKKLSYYNDNTPLFSRYQIERQIQSAFEREVRLPSGGSIVIDHTEAMLSIDINSARATKGADVETTALNTNLEAADEIARQLRIRDLGGLVVIDFIDMRMHKNQREVENRMRAAADLDRARVQVGKISKFGLLEMSRQRLRSSINESSQITCPTCGGHGSIRSMDSLIISIIRLTEEEMIKPKTGKIVIQAPMEITNKILNEKRTELSDLESRHNVPVAVISNENLNTPDFHVQRLNVNEAHINLDDIELVTPEDCHKAAALDPPPPTKEKPMLRMVKPENQAPKRTVMMLISSWFKGLFSKKKGKKRNQRGRNNKRPHNKKPHHKGTKQQNKQQHNKQHNKQGRQQQGQKKQPNKQGQKQQHNQQNQPQKQQNKQHNKQQGKQQNQQQGKQQGKQNPNAKQGQQNNQKNKQQPKHNQGQKQGQKPQNQQGKQGAQQSDAQNKNQNQNNTQGQNNKPKSKTKSIYGNKNNRGKNNKQQPDASTNKQGDQDAQAHAEATAKKMTRPLGSVADLAAKKEPMVPSGAVSKETADQEPKTQTQPKQAAPQKQEPVNKTTEKQSQASKASTEKSAPAKVEQAAKSKQTEKPVETQAQKTEATESTKQESATKENPKPVAKKTTKKKTTKKKTTKKKVAKKKVSKKTSSKAAENQAAEAKPSENKPVSKKSPAPAETKTIATDSPEGNSTSTPAPSAAKPAEAKPKKMYKNPKKITKKKVTKKKVTKKTEAKTTIKPEKPAAENKQADMFDSGSDKD